MAYRMSTTEIAYQSIVNTADPDPIPVSLEVLDNDVALVWTNDSNLAMDCLDIILPSKEEILESMTGVERSQDDLHH